MIFELVYRDSRVTQKADMHQQQILINQSQDHHPILTIVDNISIMTTTFPNLNKNNNSGNISLLLVHRVRDQQIIQMNPMKEEEEKIDRR